MTMVRVCIDSVDGETFFTMGAPITHSRRLLEFLAKHDHEGSSITLEIYDLGTQDQQTLHDEKAYEFLKKKSELPV